MFIILHSQDWQGLLLLLVGTTLVSANLLPRDKRLGHHQHHHHDHHPSDHQHHLQHNHQHLMNEHHKHHHADHVHKSSDKSGKSERKGKQIEPDFSAAELDEATGLKCVKSEESISGKDIAKLRYNININCWDQH